MAREKENRDSNTTGLMVYVAYLISLVLGVVIIGRIAQIQLFYRVDPSVEDLFPPKEQQGDARADQRIHHSR